MNFTQFEKSPLNLLKGKKKNKNNQPTRYTEGYIVDLSNDLKDLLLMVNRLNRRIKKLENEMKRLSH
tara:strand:+ start:595 stop:795 length:201 start_codon:yes stop_codon:yes gene_type:complete